MIPEQNVDHLVVELGFDRVRNLIAAMRDASIIPSAVPAGGGWGEHCQPVPRFDLDFVIRYRILLDVPEFDVYRDGQAPGGNYVRVGVRLLQGAISISAVERSTGKELTRFDYVISGRAAVYGSLETDPADKAIYFVISRIPDFFLDDQSDRVPPVFPKADVQKLL
ncbi:MAG: hypothetical protein JZU55_05460, partial [Afipia sp.]|nr:hypothetical protein [Afipia sp.]